MAVRLFAIVVLLAAGVMAVRAQHSESVQSPARPAATAPHPAATTRHEPAQTASPTSASKPVSSKTTARPPDMKTVVARIQRRIDEELPATPASPAIAKPTRSSVAPALTPTPNRRVRLVWRVSLVWPDELTEQP